MVHTKQSQRQAREVLDEKLTLSTPSRELLESLAVECATNPSPDATFQYAFCMAKSSVKSELRYAIDILDRLMGEGYDHQIDCMFGAATALYLLGDFKEARLRCEAILRTSPENTGSVEMHLACIDAAEEEEGRRVKNIAIGGSTAVAALGLVVGVAGMMLKRR